MSIRSRQLVDHDPKPFLVRRAAQTCRFTANLLTNIMDFVGFESSIILRNFKGWDSQAHRGFPEEFDSGNVSRRNVRREIGRMAIFIMWFEFLLLCAQACVFSPCLYHPRLSCPDYHV